MAAGSVHVEEAQLAAAQCLKAHHIAEPSHLQSMCECVVQDEWKRTHPSCKAQTPIQDALLKRAKRVCEAGWSISWSPDSVRAGMVHSSPLALRATLGRVTGVRSEVSCSLIHFSVIKLIKFKVEGMRVGVTSWWSVFMKTWMLHGAGCHICT